MNEYTGFAKVYDILMDNVSYDQWGEYLKEQLYGQGIRDGLVAELGCGTGKMTELLAGYGYDMIGIDLSEEMLEYAQHRKQQTGQPILYLHQDMREFELYGTVRAIVSVCDCLNYLLEEADISKVMRLVNNYLDPGGVFLFDMVTPHQYVKMGERTICENREDCSFIWENYYEAEKRYNHTDLTIFAEHPSGLYERHEEYHIQRGYELDEIRQLAEAAGMEFVAAYDAYTLDEVSKKSDRISYIVKEKGKNK